MQLIKGGTMKKSSPKVKVFAGWSKEEIEKEKKEIEKVRKIFASKGIKGEDACKMILSTRRGGCEL
ncbi:MAG: hypothetical protein N3D17_07380 [bacterium]|nr:hypothetical protein [bacterium]